MTNILGLFVDGGPFILLLLGLAAGGVFHVIWRRFWAASAVATVAGSLLWVGGCYLLFFFTAPSELNDVGPPSVVPILLTLMTALAGAIVAGGAVRMIRAAR
jgi:hypothetical protein